MICINNPFSFFPFHSDLQVITKYGPGYNTFIKFTILNTIKVLPTHFSLFVSLIC